jgi:alcohol dehydrogenase (cytochrome c)
MSVNRQRTVTLIGKIRGDEIDFTWDVRVAEGGSRGLPDGPFGSSVPPRFTAKRAPDAANAVAELANRLRRSPAVSFDRILHADREPQNWLTYSGNVLGHRFSPLTQVNRSNVKNLELAWLWQTQSQEKFEATPLVVDGVLYTVRAPNDVVAINAATGRVIWTHAYTPKNFSVCCGRVNRGLAISGGALFMGTLDAHLLAIDAYTGALLWDTTVANSADPACQVRDECYAINHAPLVVKDKVIAGTAGGDGRIRAFIAAFDVKTGKEAWRFYTIPATGEPGNETWSGDSWKIGGSAIWNVGAYDPDLNLTYWGTGNPNPNGSPESRIGDTLYSDSVVALDADTGKLKWYYQFTPHDDMDWDSAQVPVLADLEWKGRQRKLILWANRNGLMYVLDRITGEFLSGKPFVTLNWMSGFDAKGRPVRIPKSAGVRTLPGEATNWAPPSYSSSTGLYYVSSLEQSAKPLYGAVRALDPHVGEKKWEFKRDDVAFTAGTLTTASDLLFTGTRRQVSLLQQSLNEQPQDGYFYALDARSGELLWQMQLAGPVQAGPVTYAMAGKQYVVVAAGNTLFAFTLPH